VDTEARAATVRVVPAHGARARYLHRSLACRCVECTAANTRYMANYRRALNQAAAARRVAGGVQLTLPTELLPRHR
jgi:hypothetical protein